jgi:hypothetical protein
MNVARTIRFAGIGLVLTGALCYGVAFAQPAQPADAGQGAPVEAGLERQVTLTPQQQATQADSDLARMEQARAQVRRMLMDAREKRDVVKTLCLNDKLTQLNVAISSATERREALGAAVKRNDNDLSTHEFTILQVLKQRSDQLQTEANQCIGEEIGTVGQASVTTTIDKDLPDEDPSEYPDFPIVIDPPGCASCFR